MINYLINIIYLHIKFIFKYLKIIKYIEYIGCVHIYLRIHIV